MTTSSGSIPPPNALSYTGQIVVPFITRTFSPLPANNTFPVPTIWINTQSSFAYMLVSKALGNAIWVQLAGAPGTIDTITTPDSTVVVPSAGNINFLNGGGMNITGSGSSITFNSTGGGVEWVEVTGTSQAMAIDHGYVASNGALVTLTLPSTAAFGSVIQVAGKGAGGWTVAQNAGQQIFFGNVSTTIGAGGSLSSTNSRDCLTLLCITDDTEFEVTDCLGNITNV